jgi:hypothetical protein
MQRFTLVALATLALLEIAAPAFAARKRVVYRGPHRKVVVVHRTFPIRRALPIVVVRPARVRVAVAPRLFLAPVVWTAAVVSSATAVAAPTWEDSEKLARDDDWTEFTLNADAHGTKLYLQIVGTADLEFAEVVFANGDVQVVDFEAKTHEDGLYSLLDFKDGRKIDHVRMVARARSDESRIVLRLA